MNGFRGCSPRLSGGEDSSLLFLLSGSSGCSGFKRRYARWTPRWKRLNHNYAKFHLPLSLSLSLSPSLSLSLSLSLYFSPSPSAVWQRMVVLPECVRLRPGESAHGEKGAYRNLWHGAVWLPLQREPRLSHMNNGLSERATARGTMSSYLRNSPWGGWVTNRRAEEP